MTRIVALTGATGFIGHAILDRLIVSGWKVRALTRRASPALSHPAVKWIRGDLDDFHALRSLVSDASAVVHCAGAVRGKSWDDFLQVNVIGTKNILQAIAEADSCSRLLFISSLAAREPQLSWYARSKFEAEQLIPNFSSQVASAVFRPAAVYGPGDKELRPLFQAMRYGVLPILGTPGNRFGLLHVSDLVTAVSCWLDAESSITGTYEIDDGTASGYDYISIAKIGQDILGRRVRQFYVPLSGIQLLANINLWFARILNYAPMLTPGKVRELQHSNWACDISSLEKVLENWHPVIRLQTALPELIKS
jgi:nucleoside-diphosphate-sugar epimerase